MLLDPTLKGHSLGLFKVGICSLYLVWGMLKFIFKGLTSKPLRIFGCETQSKKFEKIPKHRKLRMIDLRWLELFLFLKLETLDSSLWKSSFFGIV